MTYVQKSLADMLAEIGLDRDSKPTIEDTLITERGTIGSGTNARLRWYLRERYEKHLIEHALSKEDFWELFNGHGFGGVFDHLGTNSYYRGYDSADGRKIIIRYYFGTVGVVIQVQDFGKGFNAEREMEVLMDENRDHERLRHNLGGGLNFFRGIVYEANIVSSTVEPTGTTVTVMYKYKKPKSS